MKQLKGILKDHKNNIFLEVCLVIPSAILQSTVEITNNKQYFKEDTINMIKQTFKNIEINIEETIESCACLWSFIPIIVPILYNYKNVWSKTNVYCALVRS